MAGAGAVIAIGLIVSDTVSGFAFNVVYGSDSIVGIFNGTFIVFHRYFKVFYCISKVFYRYFQLFYY